MGRQLNIEDCGEDKICYYSYNNDILDYYFSEYKKSYSKEDLKNIFSKILNTKNKDNNYYKAIFCLSSLILNDKETYIISYD